MLRVSAGWKAYPTFYVTTSQVAVPSLQRRGTVYVIAEAGRDRVLSTLRAVVQCFRILARERPDVVISSGSGSGCVLCLIGRLLGARVVWMDSIANVRRLSLSGRLIRPFADICLSQWPKVARRYRRVEYLGRVL